MPLLGSTLTLLLGPSVPVPAPPHVAEALDRVEVTAQERGRSGFQLTFRVGRAQEDVLDYRLLAGPLLQPFSRVILLVTFGALPDVLIDGVVTNQQLSPGTEPGTSTLTVTGEDVSVMMDLEERSAEHPAQPEAVIALQLIARYAQYGLIPTVVPPPSVDVPIPTERTPVQQGTDLAYLNAMAARYGYVFYVEPGAVPGTNVAYWGPPGRTGAPQRALSVNAGPSTNVTAIDFRYDGLAPTFVEGEVQDRRLGTTVPVQTFASTRVPLVPLPAWAVQPHTRTRQFRASGLDTVQAYARAQGEVDASNDRVVTASGSLDALRYEALLRPRRPVGVRGVGFSYGGFYMVQRVTHQIERGQYTQRFQLAREGLGALSPVVVP